ncbi:hypothetical protein PR003_g16465 [Phytophthora rubi]|uniref:HTH CENPB-type domain-containing protein n=1 Tax=Phytophthora rubi TaxID=129364 RepID=A0A6A3KSI1_9STRA|nr:hypothetical protein PR002_g15857 [Phytophthora rubi]KAE9325503.1 hypothetical protein PR003_g16465 [Phytophthora rubi]
MPRFRTVASTSAAKSAAISSIAQWVDELRGDGIPVSTQMLTDKALDVAEEM